METKTEADDAQVQALNRLTQEVERLNKEKEEAVANQDFEKAASLRDQADKLKKKKETITREFALLKVKHTPSALTKIKKMLPIYNARIADQSDKVVVIEQAGTSGELDSFEKEMKPFGIIEMVRSGKLVMAKGVEET